MGSRKALTLISTKFLTHGGSEPFGGTGKVSPLRDFSEQVRQGRGTDDGGNVRTSEGSTDDDSVRSDYSQLSHSVIGVYCSIHGQNEGSTYSVHSDYGVITTQ
jgi:hypothetical protein